MDYIKPAIAILTLFILTALFCWLLAFLVMFDPIVGIVLLMFGLLFLGIGAIAAIETI